MNLSNLPTVFKILKREYARFKTPYVTEVAAQRQRDPFKVLISCILSLRTKDAVTREASERLFSRAGTPQGLFALPASEIERLIYPAGFYRVKAVNIREISKRIIAEYDGKTPDTIEELLKLKGVGRKTANLVVTMGFGKPGICVDTHVHRITNRWGLVSTATPDETETALRKALPPRYWIPINDLLVAYGQNLCKPVKPFCRRCGIFTYCGRVGVKAHR
ncbi:MAG: endonuclease III [Deltaproteobacteria bacterium]|nr:endonuclease III [Deltaproteobacteria bacterium]